jgi:hypothetical protein
MLNNKIVLILHSEKIYVKQNFRENLFAEIYTIFKTHAIKYKKGVLYSLSFKKARDLDSGTTSITLLEAINARLDYVKTKIQ